MRVASVLLLACAAVSAIGQQTSRPAGMAQNLTAQKAVLVTQQTSCPVNLRVRPTAAWNVVETSKSQRPGRTQELEIALQNDGDKDVISFDAHIAGFSRHAEFQPAHQDNNAGEHAPSAWIHVDATVAAGASRSLKRTVQNIIGVRWLQLDRIAFRDGSTWQRSSAAACRVQPELLLLVAQQ